MKKNILHNKASKQVRLFTAITAIVVVIAIVLSLLLSAAPSSFMEFDLTANDLYGITYQTEELLKDLEYTIDITVISDTASLDERFVKFMEKYDALSDKVTVAYKDPVLQPSVTEEYGTDGNSIIVSCQETGRTTSFNLMGFAGYESAALLYDYNYYYTYGNLNLTSFDAEGQLAAAITNVISESTEKIYYMAGHGESSMATAVSELITKANYDIGYLDLFTSGKVPEDCRLIICNAPTTDMSDDELAILKRWLSDGGDMILICDLPELTNFNALMLTYGIQMEQGYLADMANYYEAYVNQYGPYCFWPVLNTANTISEGITSNAMLFSARPLTLVTPERRNAVTEVIMSSSPYGINYIDENNMTEGTYHAGVLASEAVSDTETTRFAVISCSMFVNENLLASFASISNKSLFMNIVNANFEGKTVMTIPARTTSLELNTVANSTMWGLFFAAMVPAIFIIAGFVFWTQRRKK